MDEQTTNKCSKCGKVNYPTGFFECEETIIMNNENVCFQCAFWISRAKKQDDKRNVVIKSDEGMEVYWLGANLPLTPCGFRGFGGRKFVIKFKNGRALTTTNLWSHGTVPSYSEDLFTVNAEFGKWEDEK